MLLLAERALEWNAWVLSQLPLASYVTLKETSLWHDCPLNCFEDYGEMYGKGLCTAGAGLTSCTRKCRDPMLKAKSQSRWCGKGFKFCHWVVCVFICEVLPRPNIQFLGHTFPELSLGEEMCSVSTSLESLGGSLPLLRTHFTFSSCRENPLSPGSSILVERHWWLV
jgi:hypothetical protein